MMCCDVGNRGAAVYGDKVFYATPDSHVIALNRETGQVVWDVTIGDWTKAQTMTVAPLVVKGKVIVGMSGAEYPTRLWIDALDSNTGAQVWRRYTIPEPGEPGGDTWGTPGSGGVRSTAAAPPGSPVPTTPSSTRSTGAPATRIPTGTAWAASATTCTRTRPWR